MSKDDSTTPLLTPLVLAIDVGSTGTRAGLYNARAEAIDGARHKEPHAFTTHADGTCVIDATLTVFNFTRPLSSRQEPEYSFTS